MCAAPSALGLEGCKRTLLTIMEPGRDGEARNLVPDVARRFFFCLCGLPCVLAVVLLRPGGEDDLLLIKTGNNVIKAGRNLSQTPSAPMVGSAYAR